ncbi:hypothetical protein CVV68_05870 [Arthrobacter livingstonensis]|uniref:Uncharacterized protein n=1 Tax=Arthrobacter livingstonensis TaxID=670078 RepID=A0A2V5LBQ4_9MICC|nr:hypothetical protein CVV68_05870 [Arthrobacter livingstonensis]
MPQVPITGEGFPAASGIPYTTIDDTKVIGSHENAGGTGLTSYNQDLKAIVVCPKIESAYCGAFKFQLGQYHAVIASNRTVAMNFKIDLSRNRDAHNCGGGVLIPINMQGEPKC